MPDTTVWPRDLSALKSVCAKQGYHWFDKDTMAYHESRLVGDLRQRRVFVQSETNPYADDNDKVRVYVVELVTRDEQGRYRVVSMSGVSVSEATQSLGTAQQQASVLASLVSKGVVPDDLEYGQDVALARAIGVVNEGSDDGWSLDRLGDGTELLVKHEMTNDR